MYDPASHSYLMGIRINKDGTELQRKEMIVAKIVELADEFGKKA